MTFEELREKHKSFTYQGFDYGLEDGNLKITFDYSISPNIKFRPQVILPNVSRDRLAEIGTEVINNLVFNLGLVEMISYWKATCSPEILIKAGGLSNEQINWWTNLVKDGLGEFYYANRIDFTRPDLVTLTVDQQNNGPLFTEALQPRDLVLVGGGKDSAVTLGLFEQDQRRLSCLIVNTKTTSSNSDVPLEISRTGGCQNPFNIQRTIDPKLIELNQQGYLNGHIPFSATLAFISVLAAVLYDYQAVVVSNESSSNEGSVQYLGKLINHQYAKSFEMEQLLHQYISQYLVSQVNYFSFLRPINELQIAKIFADYSKFHPIFRSCNKGAKTGTWCLNCSKCLFAFIVLYPFIGEKTLDIFSKNLLDDEKLKGFMAELLQLPGQFKPLECVGTKQEVEEALFLVKEKTEKENKSLPKLLVLFRDRIVEHPDLLAAWNNHHLLAPEYETLLKEKLNED